MPRGFFEGSMVKSKAPTSLVPRCGVCKLYQSCSSPKMPPTGKGRRKIMLVGASPGPTEDRTGLHFVGDSGKYLAAMLRRHGVDMLRDCILTNTLICKPHGAAERKQVDYCRPNLFRTIEEKKPDIIVPMGDVAVYGLMKQLWKDDVGSVDRWVGWQIPSQKLNAWVCPTYHPQYVLEHKDKSKALVKHFEHHLTQMLELDSKPWTEVPDYKNEIEVLYEPRQIIKTIDGWIKKGGVIAFDYETNMLKPDDPDRLIVCCSVCFNGERTIVFPFLDAAVAEAMRRLLRARSIWKIASNLKFEERWSKAVLNTRVSRWLWDTMLAAHVIDCRDDITSIKFQAFVLLGHESYDDHIKPFLKGNKRKRMNEILKEVDLHQLMVYCGLDSLLEYEVAMLQMEYLGFEVPS